MSITVQDFLLTKFDNTDLPKAAASALVGFAGIVLSYIIYQIFFHPLADYPGPFLAKFGRLWLFYQEAIVARPTERMMELHKIHGPVIRISSNELSVNDMDIYDQIYSQTSQFNKAPFFYDVFANKSGNLFTYTSREEHTHYKRLMSHVFARSQINKLEPLVYEKSTRLFDRIARASAKSEPISLFGAFRCLTLEVISDFAFGSPEPAIDGEGGAFKEVKLFDAFDAAAGMTPWLQHFPLVRSLMRSVTDYLPNDPFQKMGERAQTGLSDLATKVSYDVDRPMIFESMLAQSKKFGVELDQEMLISQGIMVLLAGTDTTAMSIAYGLHTMLSLPEVYNRLQEELIPIMPSVNSQPTLIQLESCAYLGGCVREMLRLATAVRGRLPRSVPKGGFELYGKKIPEGVFIGGSAMYSHFNEEVFESPWEFKPERWLESEDQARELQRHLVPFSKGRRGCIGINLAQMEMYIAVAQFVRRFHLVMLVDKEIVVKDHFTAYLTQDIKVVLNEVVA